MEFFTEEVKKITIKKSKIKYANVKGKCILVLNAKTTTDILVSIDTGFDDKNDFMSITSTTENCPFCGVTHSYQDNRDDKGIQRDVDGIWKTPKCRGKKFKHKIVTPNGTILYQSDGVYLNIKPEDIYITKELQ